MYRVNNIHWRNATDHGRYHLRIPCHWNFTDGSMSMCRTYNVSNSLRPILVSNMRRFTDKTVVTLSQV